MTRTETAQAAKISAIKAQYTTWLETNTPDGRPWPDEYAAAAQIEFFTIAATDEWNHTPAKFRDPFTTYLRQSLKERTKSYLQYLRLRDTKPKQPAVLTDSMVVLLTTLAYREREYLHELLTYCDRPTVAWAFRSTNFKKKVAEKAGI
jgi:hypothetical protein